MQNSRKITFLNYILSIFVIYILVNMILFPSFYLQTTLNGITAWAFNVLPAILPFIFFTKILSLSGVVEKFSSFFSKPTKFLYNTSSLSSFAFVSSIISGYPVGAKITSDLYQNGKITRQDACKMMSFCSTSGSMFIIGAVGAGMLGSVTAGYLIFIAHILGALINGIIYRKIKLKEIGNENHNFQNFKSNNLSSIVLDSALSVISVGAIIAIFFVVITSLSPLLSMFSPATSSFLGGIIEITKGCLDISALSNLPLKVILSTFIISFGGISTLFQCASLTNSFKPPIGLLILQKLTHAIFSTIIIFIILFIFPL